MRSSFCLDNTLTDTEAAACELTLMVWVVAVVVVEEVVGNGRKCRSIPSTEAVTTARAFEVAIPATSATLVGAKAEPRSHRLHDRR